MPHLSEPGPATTPTHPLDKWNPQNSSQRSWSTLSLGFSVGIWLKAPHPAPVLEATFVPVTIPHNLSPHQHQPLPQSGTPCPAHPPRNTPPEQLNLIKMRKEFAFSFHCTPSNHTSSSNFENFVPLLIISLILHFKAQRQPISLVVY